MRSPRCSWRKLLSPLPPSHTAARRYRRPLDSRSFSQQASSSAKLASSSRRSIAKESGSMSRLIFQIRELPQGTQPVTPASRRHVPDDPSVIIVHVADRVSAAPICAVRLRMAAIAPVTLSSQRDSLSGGKNIGLCTRMSVTMRAPVREFVLIGRARSYWRLQTVPHGDNHETHRRCPG